MSTIDTDALTEHIAEKIRQALDAGEAMQCTRIWEAWQYGTMTDEDFVAASDGPLAEKIAARVLPIVAEEVRAASERAWEECAAMAAHHGTFDGNRTRWLSSINPYSTTEKENA